MISASQLSCRHVLRVAEASAWFLQHVHLWGAQSQTPESLLPQDFALRHVAPRQSATVWRRSLKTIITKNFYRNGLVQPKNDVCLDLMWAESGRVESFLEHALSRKYDVLKLTKRGPFWGDMALFYNFCLRQSCSPHATVLLPSESSRLYLCAMASRSKCCCVFGQTTARCSQHRRLLLDSHQ